MCKFVGVSECVYVCAVCGCAGVNCECVHVLILHLLHTYYQRERGISTSLGSPPPTPLASRRRLYQLRPTNRSY